MKVMIRPPIEIDVDGDKCGKDCDKKWIYEHGIVAYYCDKFENANIRKITVGDGEIRLIRCQACIDAEKESTNG